MNGSRTRILIVTRNLPPLVGGMERLNWHMAEELSKVADVRIIGPAGSAALAPVHVEVREAPLQPLWKFLLHARALACREARKWRPDIVLAGSGLAAPLARSAARSCDARTAVYVHGLDVAVKHLAYRMFWLPAIRHADRVIANSHATAELCQATGVDPVRLGIVHPGVGTSPAYLESSTANEAEAGHSAFREHLGVGNGPILLSVGRLSLRKGLREFVTYALPRIVAAQPGAALLVVGDPPSQALHARAQTPANIQAAADAAGVGSCIRFLGKISDDQLDEIYRHADVHVFPIRAIPDDPEGFGMVAVEAAAHGLPTVAFSAGGVSDAVSEGVSGHLVLPNDYIGFAEAVVRTAAERNVLRSSSIAFARQFAWPEFGTGIEEQLKKIQHSKSSEGSRQ